MEPLSNHEERDPHKARKPKVFSLGCFAGEPWPEHQETEGSQAEAERDDVAGGDFGADHFVGGVNGRPEKVHDQQ
ncbi:hypothetical protein SDC9_165184 [bioreactor metagenome]|uniref:Uncharacterized protein n=1 Tax=bioreactor metagenome TaxID=1076179 RepID=A0A645FW84_9ZZZZ